MTRTTICQECGKHASDGMRLLKCSECKAVHYCSRECQRIDWKAGHKEECQKKSTVMKTLATTPGLDVIVSQYNKWIKKSMPLLCQAAYMAVTRPQNVSKTHCLLLHLEHVTTGQRFSVLDHELVDLKCVRAQIQEATGSGLPSISNSTPSDRLRTYVLVRVMTHDHAKSMMRVIPVTVVRSKIPDEFGDNPLAFQLALINECGFHL